MPEFMEIERKFLVKGDFLPFVTSSDHIVQGYLCSGGGRSVRICTRGERGFITIKGPSLDGGMSRFEWEKEIPVDEAVLLLRLSDGAVIDKTRHLVPFEGHVFEVDVFHGDNEGLVVAEVELSSPDEDFGRPSWLGEEVTGDKRYYNSSLRRHPFCEW